ncbi:MFS general substrate transporter [Jaminaea rosea]|uniref:MFS general substrate transporter n=1 Tax=Jaminaea rosea TaxID=1569628 RepID=A0A316UI21_9BASI|nr:MFS general substrate transporter [Jaminaea rosea]PWN24554.1 MFS general substrate transporter [Jaminaea rosea]
MAATKSHASPLFDPYSDPAHPTNAWPAWRRHAMLATLAFQAFSANYAAGAHLTIFPQMSEYFGVSIEAIANSIGISILGLGVGSLLWCPLAQAIGHRPVYLIAWTFFVPCAFWMAFAKDYSTFAAGRFFAGFAGSISQVLPATSIAALYKPEWRGTAVSVWALLLIMGPPAAPLITSAVTLAHEWQYCYYVVIIFVGVEWFLVFAFCGETLYTPPQHATPISIAATSTAEEASDEDHKGDKEKEDAVHTSTRDDLEGARGGQQQGHVGYLYNPLRDPMRFLKAAAQPLAMACYVSVLLPCLWAAVAFGWSVGTTIILPQVLHAPAYDFGPILIGCAFLAILVGSVIGKICGGIISDRTVTFLATRNGADGVRRPEYRLWALLLPTLILLPAMILFGYGWADRMAWWVSIVFGAGLYYIGNVAVSSIVQTYIAENDISRSMSSVSVFNFTKCVFSFGVPFYLPSWTEEGTFKSSYLAQGLIVSLLGLAMLGGLIAFGGRLRRWQGLPTA